MVLSGRDPTIRPRLTNMPGCITDNRVLEFWYGRHPLFPGQRTIRRARRILAEKLNRQLATTEHAHHKNGNTLDDRRSNVELMPKGEHSRKTHTGRINSQATREKMSKSLYRTWITGKRSRVASLETREKMSKAHQGKLHTPETRQKISQWHKLRKGVE